MGNAGAIDRQIQFQRATSADDGYGVVTSWANHGGLQWASKADVSDGERWRASEVSAIITTRFVVRYSEFTRGITPKDRLTCDGFSYDISGIKEIDGRRKWLEITAAARSDL
jgi:SPP1 family predicted phage head-tail adaptor